MWRDWNKTAGETKFEGGDLDHGEDPPGMVCCVRDIGEGPRPIRTTRTRMTATDDEHAAVGGSADAPDLAAQLADALALQTATSDVLRLISAHPGDLRTVLDGILAKAIQLCNADGGTVIVPHGDVVRVEAVCGLGEIASLGREIRPMKVTLEARDRRAPALIDDLMAVTDDPVLAGLREGGIAGSLVSIPLFHDDAWIGNINLVRHEVRPFERAQVAVLQTFADQAAIAIANARLFNDLDAALEQQTASAEIMRVISSSPGDLERTLPEIARTAKRLSNAADIAVTFGDGDTVRAWDERRGFRLMDGTVRRLAVNKVLRDVIASGRPEQLVGSVDSWLAENPGPTAISKDDGITDGAVLFVPLLGSTGNVGFIIASRDVPVAFSPDEIRLLEGFADQAVIAIENAGLFTRLEERNTELGESLELQTATSEVLALISAHPGDLKTVLDGILARASDLVGTELETVLLRRGDVMRIGASSASEQFVGMELPFDTVMARLADAPFAINNDYDPSASSVSEFTPVAVERGISRRLSAALVQEGELIGIISLYRSGMPFEDRDGQNLKTFADQAAIAISNSKLFNDLDAALERSKAMTDVLDAVSTARTDLQPVFDAVIHYAHRLFAGSTAVLYVREGDELVWMGGAGGHPDAVTLPHETVRRLPIDVVATPVGEAAATGRVVHVRNWNDVPAHLYPMTMLRNSGRLGTLAAPMIRNGVAVGVISFTRAEAGGYTDEEIALLQTFANQAAIAVDNARLLVEIDERNTELSESLELQTATSEVLRLISAYPGDLRPVLDGILERAVALCDADLAVVLLREGDVLRVGAEYDFSEIVGVELPIEHDLLRRSFAEERQVLLYDDLQEFEVPRPEHLERGIRAGARSGLNVPLLTDGEWVGTVVLLRREVRPFDEAHGVILLAFADQVSLAMANTRLFTNLDAALERQKAMTEVLDAVSTARTDLQPVFEAVTRHAFRLCESDSAVLLARNGDRLEMVAGQESPFAQVAVGLHIGLTLPIDPRTSAPSEAAFTGRLVHIRNWDDLPHDQYPKSVLRGSGLKSTLHLPLLRNNEVVGVLGFTRAAIGGYGDSEVSLLQTFANQAAIAVDNARLLREIEQRNNDLSESLELQTATSDVLRLISANPGDLRTVLEGILEKAASLCGAESGTVFLRREDVLGVRSTFGEGAAGLAGFEAPVSDLGLIAASRNRRPRFLDDFMQLRDPLGIRIGRQFNIRSWVSIALVQDEEWIGNIVLFRHEVRPFDARAGRHPTSIRGTGRDRHQQREPVQGTGGADAHCRRGKRRQGVVPGHHEPRDPHTDERSDRHERAAARHRPGAPPARVRGDHPVEWRVVARHHQRHPRLLQDRRRSSRTRNASLRSAGLHRVGLRSRDRTGCQQGARARVPDRPCGAGGSRR